MELHREEMFSRGYSTFQDPTWAQRKTLLVRGTHQDNSEMEPDYQHLLPQNWEKLVQTWLDEDLPGFDVGGYVVGSKEETAILYGKNDGVLAGRPFFERIFAVLGCKVYRCPTGAMLLRYVKFPYDRGKARPILRKQNPQPNSTNKCCSRRPFSSVETWNLRSVLKLGFEKKKCI